MAGQAEALRALLSAAPHVAAATLQEGTTALHYAAECGKTDCIDVLLAAAPQLARTAAGDSEVLPIHLAAMHGQPEVGLWGAEMVHSAVAWVRLGVNVQPARSVPENSIGRSFWHT